MLGTIINTAAILLGSLLGSIFKKGIKEDYQAMLLNAMGIAVITLGINAAVSHMPESRYPVLFLFSLAIGTLIGTALRLDSRFQSLAARFSKGNLSKGISTGILLFCIGTLSILGPVQAALYGDLTYLFTNASLDFVTSTVLASTYGIGMMLTAPVLFLWQGSIYVLSLMLGSFLSAEMMTEISIVGGILILGSGLSILNIKDCRTMNMIPSLFIPILFCMIMDLF